MPSDEPNKNMDDLLKAYAKKRREQAEPALEMHPATRKMLQEEVKRALAAPPKHTRSNWFSGMWGVGALGGAFAVLLLLFVVFRMPMNDTARTAPPPSHTLRDSKAVAPAAAPAADKNGLSEAASAAAAPANLAGSAAPSGAGAAPPADSLAQSARREMRYGGRGPQANSSVLDTEKNASAPPPGSAGPDVAEGAFVQVQSSAAESPPSNILSNFRVSRAGQNVRVVDGDGSIYDGQVLDDFASDTRQDFTKKTQQQAKDISQAATANYAFKVAGTNRLAQQRVVFTGSVSNILDMPVAAPAGQMASAQNQKASQTQNMTSNGIVQSAQTQNSHLTGKVQVGGGREFQIEAKTPPP
jgi:hypothetical protein